MKKVLLIFSIGLLGVALTSCGAIAKSVANDLFKEIDSNSNQSISRPEFSTWLAKSDSAKEKAKKKGMSMDDYSKFRFNEIDTSNDDKITYGEFQQALK